MDWRFSCAAEPIPSTREDSRPAPRERPESRGTRRVAAQRLSSTIRSCEPEVAVAAWPSPEPWCGHLRSQTSTVSRMTRLARFRFHLLFGGVFVCLWIVVSWLVMSNSSPIHTFFLYDQDQGLREFWMTLHRVPIICGMVASGNVHQPSALVALPLAVVQWLVVGVCLSFAFTGFRLRSHDNG